MEDILKGLGNTATLVSKIQAALPHLATAASVSDLRSEMWAMHTALIKWIVATALTSTGLATTLAFSIAKFVH